MKVDWMTHSRDYINSKFSKMASGCHLEFDRTGNSAISSADPGNPILEPNTKWIG